VAAKRRKGEHANTGSSQGRRKPWRGNCFSDRPGQIERSGFRAVGERETPGALRGVQCCLARDSAGEPSMKSGGETVERVRNPEDGRFRAVVEATGIDGRQASSSAEGERNPRRGAPALRVRLRL